MKKFPTAFTILFGLIVVVAALTWIIPAGQYERAMNETLGKEAPVPGTYHQVEPNPQGLKAVLMAPIAGLYDPATGTANAIDVAVFVLVIGGFLAVVTKTGAIDAGIGWLLDALKGREIWMIPILMAAFAAGGTSYGMAEESLAFYAIVLPVFIRAGYDALTGVAVIMLGCGIGTLGSTFNAFATVIGSNAAGVPFTDGLLLRVFILFACLAAGILFVMRYAQRVKADPARSVVAAQREENIAHFLKGAEVGAPLPEFTRVREIILALFALTFAMMLYGVIARGWWMGEMSALFLGMAILTFFVAKFDAGTRMDEHTFVDTFVERRPRPARGGADHRGGARHRRGDGRGQDHRHHPARARGGAGRVWRPSPSSTACCSTRRSCRSWCRRPRASRCCRCRSWRRSRTSPGWRAAWSSPPTSRRTAG